MGRPNTVLTIVVKDAWLAEPEIAALKMAGHNVLTLVEWARWILAATGAGLEPADPDLVLHTAAHAWDPSMFDGAVLTAALKAARKRRKDA